MKDDEEEETLNVKKLIKYCQRALNVLPYAAKSLDVNRYYIAIGEMYISCTALYTRMTILFFGVCGLDILNALDTIQPNERDQIIEWIYAQQVLPDKTGITDAYCGFRGGSYMGTPFDSKKVWSHRTYILQRINVIIRDEVAFLFRTL